MRAIRRTRGQAASLIAKPSSDGRPSVAARRGEPRSEGSTRLARPTGGAASDLGVKRLLRLGIRKTAERQHQLATASQRRRGPALAPPRGGLRVRRDSPAGGRLSTRCSKYEAAYERLSQALSGGPRRAYTTARNHSAWKRPVSQAHPDLFVVSRHS